MNIETFFEARDLYDKYQLCEKVMEYMSNEESVKGQKYLETLKQFMTFVHERMEAVGMQFSDLHCPEHSEQPDVPTPPTEPKEPKFAIGSKVEIVDSKFKGHIGTVKDFDAVTSDYYVASDFTDNGTLFSMWFPESFLKSYVEESEEKIFAIGEKVWYHYNEDELLLCKVVGYEENSNRIIIEFKENEDSVITFHVNPEELEKYEESEEPTPPEDEDDKYELVYGERVIVKSGEYAGKVGTIIDVMVGFTKILVGLDDVEDAVEFTPDQLAKYTDPENTEENGETV